MRNRAIQPARSPRAFSLVEVVITLTITATLAAVALPRYARAISRYRLESAARQIATDIDYARARANSLSASRTVTFDPTKEIYTISAEVSRDDPGRKFLVDLSQPPHRVQIDKADMKGDAELIFDGYGMPDGAGEIVLLCGDLKVTITVDADTGKATIGTPTLAP